MVPFRADVVGSLLRPQAILDVRARRADGKASADDVWQVESAAVADAVALQREAGLKVCTDGEFHRRHWFLDFIERIDGVVISGGMPARFHNEDGDVEFAPPRIEVRGKLGRSSNLALDEFSVLKPFGDRAGLLSKQCIPAPTILHFRGGRAAVDTAAYPDMDAFFADLARVYAQEIRALYDAGCRYLQIDETNLPFMCDPSLQGHLKSIGEDRDALVRKYVKLVNDSVRGAPPDMTICMHMCRGNHESSWIAEGGYDPVAEVTFSELNVRGFFLEYDSPRAGGFAPLRYLGKDKIAVLGLITTKKAELESKDDIRRRIDEAVKVAPLDRLALSPQCGFASTLKGNRLTMDDQKRKLALVVEVADEVWGNGVSLDIRNSFSVPAPVAQAWTVLNDIRRVAACVPGAELTEIVDETTYKGTIAVRLGPVALTFGGTAAFRERDPGQHRAVIAATGNELKGRGAARATVTCTLHPDGEATRVDVATALDLAGAVAQYGRAAAMIESVAQQLVAQFAQALAADMRGEAADTGLQKSEIKLGSLIARSLLNGVRGQK